MKALNKYNINNWYKMLTNKSILHVNQGVGKVYSEIDVKGYYNDLTEKVLKGDNLDNLEVPKTRTVEGKEITFPVAVFQYGLGAYDLYLMNGDFTYLEKFKTMANWALNNQEKNGAWNNFFFIYPENPYSAMAQGEGASLLIRAYQEFNDVKYLYAAKRAIEFMLIPLKDGGTTSYNNNDVYFQEYTHKSTVLNGWIFALFGMYDYIKISNDSNYNDIFSRSLETLRSNLASFDNGYWSLYNMDGSIITSSFYNNLHIAQLEVLYNITKINEFKVFSEKWRMYQKNLISKTHAFIVKVHQKLNE